MKRKNQDFKFNALLHDKEVREPESFESQVSETDKVAMQRALEAAKERKRREFAARG